MNREEWLQGLAGVLRPGFDVTALPSFPAGGRGARVCGLARDENGRTLALVSPLLADSAEVGVVLAYLLDRQRWNGVGGRWSARASRHLERVGWRVNGWTVDPADNLAERIITTVDRYVAEHGDYPSRAVAPTVNRQTTRMLALTCPVHADVRVRAARSQIEAGAPLCGRPVSAGPARAAIPCASVLVEA